MKNHMTKQVAKTGQWTGVCLLSVLVSSPVVMAEFRSEDSSGNNIANPNWGMAGDRFILVGPAAYDDGGVGDLVSNSSYPNVRQISNEVFRQPEDVSVVDERGLSEFAWVWGQFIAHDIDHTSNQSGDGAESIDITIPAGDLFFTEGQVIPATRAVFDPGTGTDAGNPRAQVNNLTAYIDASTVYGSDATRMGWLRDPTGGGRLKVSASATGDLLARNGDDPMAPSMVQDGFMGAATFVTGDVRGNEHVALTSTHTLFTREHNRLAALIDATHADLPVDPTARDEEIFQRARKIVGAEIQAITYNEFLPALGISLSGYTGYDDTVNASIASEFSTGAFRMGHSQTNNLQLRLNEDGTVIPEGHLALADMFFDPGLITDEGGIEPVLRGLAASVQEAHDVQIVEGLRSLLFGALDPSGLIANGTDLGALDLLRARDFGVADYNTVRQAYGLEAKTSFEDITDNVSIQEALASLYSDVDSVDLFVGLLAEPLEEGTSLSETSLAIMAEQFQRLRDGDRFFFHNDTDLLAWAAPDLTDMSSADDAFGWLQDLSLADVIRLNTSVSSIQDDVFFVSIPEPSIATALGMFGLATLSRRKKVSFTRYN